MSVSRSFNETLSMLSRNNIINKDVSGLGIFFIYNVVKQELDKNENDKPEDEIFIEELKECIANEIRWKNASGNISIIHLLHTILLVNNFTGNEKLATILEEILEKHITIKMKDE